MSMAHWYEEHDPNTFLPLLVCCCFRFPLEPPNPFTSLSRTIEGGFILRAPPHPGAIPPDFATGSDALDCPGTSKFRVGGAEITAVDETETLPEDDAAATIVVVPVVKAPIGKRDVAGLVFGGGARRFGANANAADQAVASYKNHEVMEFLLHMCALPGAGLAFSVSLSSGVADATSLTS